MHIIGSNCHITLRHPDINGGEAYGFVLDPASHYPEGLAIKREVFTGLTIPMKVWVYFDVLLADDLINPDGSRHEANRQEMYTMLMAYLGKLKDIQFGFGLGAIVGLGAIEYAATEKHYAGYSTIRVHLTNAGGYQGVIDESRFNLSFWDGDLTWETGYWR
ncbi:MAG: hypothetical protein LLG42_08180 [Chloroflexi bacterium]|nr:hypothetical protein [Chloroflexota bacterium]